MILITLLITHHCAQAVYASQYHSSIPLHSCSVHRTHRLTRPLSSLQLPAYSGPISGHWPKRCDPYMLCSRVWSWPADSGPELFLCHLQDVQISIQDLDLTVISFRMTSSSKTGLQRCSFESQGLRNSAA